MKEPVFAPFSTPASIKRQRNGSTSVKEPVFAPFSRNTSVEDGKIGLPDASVFIALMPGIPDAVRISLAPRN